jgi:uncharacterized membrane protein
VRKVLIVLPLMAFFANFVVLLNIPILREIVVFAFLSFIPGFAILRLFKLKETTFLDTFIFSVALSIAFVMFMGLLVNEFYLFLGFSQSLSTIPLMVVISAFTLTVFFVEYRRDLSETFRHETSFEGELKNILPLSILLFLIPLLSVIGVLYLNVLVILFSDAIIAVLCVMSVVFRKLIPENLFPFLIFSISVALVCQFLLSSQYISGWDANLEYYVFRLTQLNGHWGFLNATVNSIGTLNYNSMLSITLLPAVYSTLMNAQSQIVFKILYPFIFFLVPLTLYRICEKQFGKLIGLLSALFFIFTPTAFYGEPLSLNRQMVGELFLVLSIFLLINKTLPLTKRRLLLIIFGAALAISHYSLAFIYLVIVALVFIISRVKPIFDNTLNTVTVLLLFVMTFSWYTLNWAPLILFTKNIEAPLLQLITGIIPTAGAASTTMFATPQVFTASTWINLLLSGIANLFLIIGVLAIILQPKGTGISAQFKVMLTIAAFILIVSLIVPNISTILNFNRFYGITLLFLSPCFVLGGQTLIVTLGKALMKIKRPLKRQFTSKNKNLELAFFFVAIILSAYFLSQVGFVNRVSGGAIYSYRVDFDRVIMSNDSQVKIGFYNTYTPEQDVFSASWLSYYKVESTKVFADDARAKHVLVSYALIPSELLLPITNTISPQQGSLVYLGTLNIVNGIITTITGSFNTSEISFLRDQNNIVYSNGNSEIWYVAPSIDSP